MTEHTSTFTECTIAPITHGDVDAIAALDTRVSATPWNAVDYENMIAQKNTQGFVARHNDSSLLGFIIARVVDNECEIFKIAVAEKFQKKGIGTCLLKSVCAMMAAKETYSIFLEVSITNQGARALYRKCGFKEIYSRKNYYGGNSDAVAMSFSGP